MSSGSSKYILIISAKANKKLKEIAKEHKQAVVYALQDIKDYPSLVGKSLGRDLKGRFSYRMGIYRIIYQIHEKDKTILVISAGHRGVIYN